MISPSAAHPGCMRRWIASRLRIGLQRLSTKSHPDELLSVRSWPSQYAKCISTRGETRCKSHSSCGRLALWGRSIPLLGITNRRYSTHMEAKSCHFPESWLMALVWPISLTGEIPNPVFSRLTVAVEPFSSALSRPYTLDHCFSLLMCGR